MTSIHSSSQKFDKADWIQQKIEEIRERCGTANSGEIEDEQHAEVRRRMVGALGRNCHTIERGPYAGYRKSHAVWSCCITAHRATSAW